MSQFDRTVALQDRGLLVTDRGLHRGCDCCGGAPGPYSPCCDILPGYPCPPAKATAPFEDLVRLSVSNFKFDAFDQTATPIIVGDTMSGQETFSTPVRPDCYGLTGTAVMHNDDPFAALTVTASLIQPRAAEPKPIACRARSSIVSCSDITPKDYLGVMPPPIPGLSLQESCQLCAPALPVQYQPDLELWLYARADWSPGVRPTEAWASVAVRRGVGAYVQTGVALNTGMPHPGVGSLGETFYVDPAPSSSIVIRDVTMDGQCPRRLAMSFAASGVWENHRFSTGARWRAGRTVSGNVLVELIGFGSCGVESVGAPPGPDGIPETMKQGANFGCTGCGS